MVMTAVHMATAMSGTAAVRVGERRKVATATAVSTSHQHPSVSVAHAGAVRAVIASRTTPARAWSARLAIPTPRASTAHAASSLGSALSRNPKAPLMPMWAAMPMRMSRVRQTA